MTALSLLMEASAWWFWAWVLFGIKHIIADYMLQTPKMLQEKSSLFRPGGWIHVGIHGFGTLLVLGFLWYALTVPVDPIRMAKWIGILVVADILVHYLIDYTKSSLTEWRGWTPADRMFWVAFGIDQFLHLITYAGLTTVFWGIVLIDFLAGPIKNF